MTDADRTVRVRLEAEVTKYVRDVRHAGQETDKAFRANAAVAKTMNNELANTDKRMKDVDRSTIKVDATIRGLNGNLGRSTKQLDKFSGRLGLILQGLAVLGPAVVPLTAVALPALTGLAAQAGIAALAGGTMAIAFQGVGDALKAIEKAELAPTAENLAEMNRLLQDLHPSARAFVAELDGMDDTINKLQEAAAAGFFPGALEGLQDLQSMLRPIRNTIAELADVAGDSSAELADMFDSRRTREFLTFIRGEARPAMSNLLATAGNLAAGMGELWMAFDPLNDDAGDWFLEQSEAFDRWASNLDKTEGFQDFVAYIRANGPQVAETLGAIGNMALQIVEAAAPIGGPVLEGIELFADAVSAIADSPIGPTLIQAAAAATLLNHSLKITNTLLARMGVEGKVGKGGGAGAAIMGSLQSRTDKARVSVHGLRNDLSTIATTRNMPQWARTTRELQHYDAAVKNVRSTLGGYAKAAGGAAAGGAALALVATDAGRGLGLQNTAMGAMVGSMAGPWGTAIGAGVGYLLDFRAAAAESEDAIKAFHDAVDGGVSTLSEYATANKQLQSDDAGFDFARGKEDVDSFSEAMTHLGKSFTAGGLKNNLDIIFGGPNDTAGRKLADEAEEAQRNFEGLTTAADALAGRIMGETRPSIDQMDEALRRAAPAMHALGITTEDLLEAGRHGGLTDLLDQIEGYQRHADSAAGRTEAFGDSVTELGNDALSTAESAAVMGSALEALLSPTLNAEEATDAWRASLQALREGLNDDAGFKGFGKNAMENRAITRDYVNTSMERLTALAGLSTTTEEDMAKAVRQTRREFIASGIAAGFSEKEITARANALGLTPKLVRTAFEAAGIDAVDLKARRLRALYADMPKDLRTHIRTEGVPKTKAEVDELVEKYKLTEKERKTLVTLMDEAAKRGITNMKALLADLDRDVANPSVEVDSEGARRELGWFSSLLRGLDGDTATTYVKTVQLGAQIGTLPPRKRASGGAIMGPGTETSDSINARLSHNEHIWSAREVRGAGGHAAMERMRAMARVSALPKFADGGAVARMSSTAGTVWHRRESAATSRGTGPTSMVVTGTLQTPWGPARIEGVARDVAREEIDADRRFESVRRGKK